MVISKKKIVFALALIAIICIVMNKTEAESIGSGAMSKDEMGCNPPNCHKQQANPYKPGCDPIERCRGG
ncbi:hypothetical protein EUTSA_v10017504mg [Eutrema salsugineum]|uniref:Uncharacterized protein n=1 Tax=Eutrema salsugineum TaxID=72664 RepID=V4MH35_EUTSA|nr:protein RALF-like 36 [Eutrema salsugineum]ESQ51878.1 hypothetical protein EUTSA_v10017504mg [Eutrema salsugineum]